MKTAKQQLITIIKFLSNNDFYYCKEYEGIYQYNECYCADDILQEAHDRIYTAVRGILGSFSISPKEDLTDEIQDELINEAYEQAERFHIRFNNLKQQEALEAINNNKELKQILLDRYKETAHK